MEKRDEVRLIELAAAGDRAASSQLIQAHQQSVYSYMLRMCGNPDLAEDVVQDAFVRVLLNLDRFDTRFRFSTWLFTIAKRLWLNRMQKMKPVYDTEIVGGRSGGGHEPWERSLAAESRRRDGDAIGRALQELGADQREIVVLFHQQDWPISRIAEFKGMPEGTVKSHLHRGRRKMRDYFERFESAELASRFGGAASVGSGIEL
jgi:RNA polymerase sigma-70 factor (ECF subfamily)